MPYKIRAEVEKFIGHMISIRLVLALLLSKCPVQDSGALQKRTLLLGKEKNARSVYTARMICHRVMWLTLASSKTWMVRAAGMASTTPITSFFPAPKRLRVGEAIAKEVDSGINSPRISAAPPGIDHVFEKEILCRKLTTKQHDTKEIAAISNGAQSEGVPKPSVEEEVSESQEEKSPEFSKEQKVRMEINKAAARAKRNLRLCEERVADAKASGVAFPEMVDLLVDQTWLGILQGELRKQYMDKLAQFVSQEAGGKFPIYPPAAKVFNAFNACPFDSVKVVILGQDPYHGPGQAMGLSFSVPQGIKVPSSLVNIYKEIQSDVGCSIPSHGNLEKWAYQGVLLLNAVLTVRDHHANSHAKKGWEMFTDAAIRALSQQRTGIVFLLWGNSAQEKTRLINVKAHHILKAAHPSGLSAHRGFFGCRHFSQTNKLLETAGQLPIDWQL